jgi:HK97 family phage prohead protease
MEHEIRYFTTEVRAITNEAGQPLIAGISPTFNVVSEDLGGFREVILPSALNGVLENADVRGRFDHDLILGRNKSGTLSLELRDEGLYYEITINQDDPEAMGAYARVKRGDVDGASFMFDVDEKGQKWTELEDGSYLRTIHQLSGLHDVGPVAFPAYTQSSAYVRSKLSALKKQSTNQDTGAGEPGAIETAPQVRLKRNRHRLDIEKVK